MVLFALLRSKSDAGTAASDCQQYWALFGLRVYAARGAAGLATAPSKLSRSAANRLLVAPRERLLACTRGREPSAGLVAGRNPAREKPAQPMKSILVAANPLRPTRYAFVDCSKTSLFTATNRQPNALAAAASPGKEQLTHTAGVARNTAARSTLRPDPAITSPTKAENSR